MKEQHIEIDNHRSEEDWEIIVDAILDGRCILFLGPRIFSSNNFSSLEEQIANYLDVDNNTNIENYFVNDALFQFVSPTARTKTAFALMKFLESNTFDGVAELYEKISDIPFQVIFSLTPDDLLTKTFEKAEINYRFDYYLMNHSPNNYDKPIHASVATPLIYNMFGTIKNMDSLVLTHDDLFDYIYSILNENSMHSDLKNIIRGADCFIFLGASFDKWYMQILIKLLYRFHSRVSLLRYANYELLDDQMQRLYTQQFKIEFINENIEEFVDRLFDQISLKKKLRSHLVPGTTVELQLRELIRENKTEEAINGFICWIDKILAESRRYPGQYIEAMKTLYDRLYNLSSRLTRLREREMDNIISAVDAGTELSSIHKILLEHISGLDRR